MFRSLVPLTLKILWLLLLMISSPPLPFPSGTICCSWRRLFGLADEEVVLFMIIGSLSMPLVLSNFNDFCNASWAVSMIGFVAKVFTKVFVCERHPNSYLSASAEGRREPLRRCLGFGGGGSINISGRTNSTFPDRTIFSSHFSNSFLCEKKKINKSHL